jgi:carbon monoxide dehydrogenase subunit G
MTGSRQLAATRPEVWAKLNDAEVLKRCIPGCDALAKLSDTEFKGTVALKIGPMAARFDGNVKLSNLNPPASYRISGSGKGGPAGMASGGANVRLEQNASGTLLTYDVDAKVSGKIAQLGQRLVDATAAQLADKFFANFAREVEGPSAAATGGSGPKLAPRRLGLTRWLVGGAFVGALALAAYLIWGSGLP